MSPKQRPCTASQDTPFDPTCNSRLRVYPHRADPNLRLWSPSPTSKRIAIIIPGGAYCAVASHDIYPTATLLSKRGLAVFILEGYSVAKGGKRAPRRGDIAYPNALIDGALALLAVQTRAKDWGLDPAHLLVGASAGGHMAGFLATNGVARLKDLNEPALQALAPPFAVADLDAVHYLEPGSTPGVTLTEKCLLGLSPSPSLLTQMNNTHHVSLNTSTHFIFHCARDPEVPVAQAQTMYAALRAVPQRPPRDVLVVGDCASHHYKGRDKYSLPALDAWLSSNSWYSSR